MVKAVKTMVVGIRGVIITLGKSNIIVSNKTRCSIESLPLQSFFQLMTEIPAIAILGPRSSNQSKKYMM